MKFKQKKTTKTILSDKIADALTVKPRPDIEDDQVFNTKPQTVSRADLSSSDSEDEAVISDFRKRSVNLLSDISKKYEGQVVSRKDLIQQSDDSEDEFDSEDQYVSQKQSSESKDDVQTESSDEEAQLPTKIKDKVASDSEDFTSDGEGESDDYSITKFQKESESEDNDGSEGEEDDEGEGYDISQMEEPVKEEFEHLKKQNVSEEAKKGNCVRNQLLVWEGLLEMRIHLQRCISTANQMPLPDTYKDLKTVDEFAEESNVTKANVINVLDKLLLLQSMLFKNYPETKTLATAKKGMDINQKAKQESDEEIPSDTDNEEIPSDTDGEENNAEIQEKKMTMENANSLTPKKRKLDDYEHEIAKSHKAFKSFRDTTIQKWNEKTRLATAANIKNTPTNTILQQISYILSDRNKLIRRTQLKRSDYEIIGYKKPSSDEIDRDENGITVNPVTRDRKDNDEYISEIFDDSDFYHQLLRELIECKSTDISDPVQLSRQWIALQQMRSKMKRKVDTKATKGRKIKYVVHNELVSYMAPEKCTTWTDESANELYSSLFGKMFEHNNIGVDINLENGFKINN